ncbi:MAG TPA: histidine phosphatase family protein [Candidatus Methylomirabilis sp.]|nr:histidine phosphatase family protein [Candidatus Methylomirabilis sp.]
MSLRLVLVRHGETDWNRERRYQGQRDTPLSETGRAQAEAAGRLLAREQFQAVWSSPLRRARDTAAAIAAPKGLAVRVDEAFGEMRFGQWEGLTVDDVSARFPDLHRQWQGTPHLVAPPDAETLDEVRARTLKGLEGLRAAHDGQTVCLVTHGVTSRVLILEALGLGLDRIWSLHVSLTGITELEFRDDWAVVHRMNTLVHLDQLPQTR